MVLALQRRAASLRMQGLEVPFSTGFVVAAVMRRGTPDHVLRRVIGDEQARQSSVRRISIPDFARLLLLEHQRTDRSDSHAVRLEEAYLQAGWDRSLPLVCTPRRECVRRIEEFFHCQSPANAHAYVARDCFQGSCYVKNNRPYPPSFSS